MLREGKSLSTDFVVREKCTFHQQEGVIQPDVTPYLCANVPVIKQ